jgi:hypothetical protein
MIFICPPSPGGGGEDEVVVNIRNPHAQLVEIGHRLAQFVEGGGVRHQLLRFPPEAAQIEIQLALHVHEQGAVALPLQHGAAVGGLDGEVVLLPLGMGAVVADAVFHPVLQPGEAELGQQERRLGEEVGQAGAGEGGVVAMDGAGGALHHVQGDLQVMPHQLPGMQAAGDRRQGLQEGGDGLAVGRLLHLHDEGHYFGQCSFVANGLGNGRPFLQEHQQGFDAAPQLADDAGGIQVMVDVLPGEDGQGFRHDVLEHVLHLLEAGVELGPVGLHQGVLVGGFGVGHGHGPGAFSPLSQRGAGGDFAWLE